MQSRILCSGAGAGERSSHETAKCISSAVEEQPKNSKMHFVSGREEQPKNSKMHFVRRRDEQPKNSKMRFGFAVGLGGRWIRIKCEIMMNRNPNRGFQNIYQQQRIPTEDSKMRAHSVILLLLVIFTIYAPKTPAADAFQTLFHPADLLPLLPRQVSWPITKLLSDPADLLPEFMGTTADPTLYWKGGCFDYNTAILLFHNDSGSRFGGGTLYIQVSNGKTLTCIDTYVFATPFRVTWDYFLLAKGHKVEFPEWDSEAEFEYVKNRGVSIFLMQAGAIGILRALSEALHLFSTTEKGENSNLAFLKKHMGASFEERPQPWVTNITTDEIHSGDFLAISKIRGPWGGFETLEKWVTGAYVGHSAVCLRDSEGKLWVAESGHENEKREDVIAILPWDEWWEFELTKDDSNPHIALLPLHPEIRAHFDESAAWEYAKRMSGKPYGYHNLIFSWIDTQNDNYPPPLNDNLVASAMTVWTRMNKSAHGGRLWNEALNKRLGTQNLSDSQVITEAEKRGSSLGELLAIPEQDDWVYGEGKSRSCVAFVFELYKKAGVFGTLTSSIQATEFTLKDAYSVNLYEGNSSRLPRWCNDGDSAKMGYCQIKGKYRMELPGYNTMLPYAHMNQKCASLPPKYQRSSDC